MHQPQPLIFCGSSHADLGNEICQDLGISNGKLSLSRFPDGEVAVEILENVQGRNTYIVQTLAGDINNYLIELLIIMDALKRASAKKIVPIIPYYAYSRQDRKDRCGEPITARLVADLLKVAGANQIITLDLHAAQIEGFFDIPVTHIHCQELLASASKQFIHEPAIIVGPDIGSIKIVEKFARFLSLEMAVIEKQRKSSSFVDMRLIGNVKDRNVLIVDDMCSTGHTLIRAALLCQNEGAKQISCAFTHPIFSAQAIEEIAASPINHMVFANTIPSAHRFTSYKNTHCISVARLIADAIRNEGTF